MQNYFIPDNPYVGRQPDQSNRPASDIMELLETPVILQFVAGKSLKQMCEKSVLSIEALIWLYSRTIDSAVIRYDARPVECGLELVKAPDGNHYFVPELKWVPLTGRDSTTGNYEWKTVDSKVRELGSLGKTMLHRKISVRRPIVADDYGLYISYREVYDSPLRMGNYRLVLTVEAMCPDFVREGDRLTKLVFEASGI